MKLLFKTMKQTIDRGGKYKNVFKIELLNYQPYPSKLYSLKISRFELVRSDMILLQDDFEFICGTNEVKFINENNLMCLWDILSNIDNGKRYYKISYVIGQDDYIISCISPVGFVDLDYMTKTYSDNYESTTNDGDIDEFGKGGTVLVPYKYMKSDRFHRMSEPEMDDLAKTLLKGYFGTRHFPNDAKSSE